MLLTGISGGTILQKSLCHAIAKFPEIAVKFKENIVNKYCWFLQYFLLISLRFQMIPQRRDRTFTLLAICILN